MRWWYPWLLFFFLRQSGAVTTKLEGADTGALAAQVAKLREDAAGDAPYVPPPTAVGVGGGASTGDAAADFTARLQALIRWVGG